MNTKTKYLAFLLTALALAGGSGQAPAAMSCGSYPAGSCLTGDRCGAGGLWIKDSTCPIAIDQQPGSAEQREKTRDGPGVGSGTIFDRWGNYKTKASCESAGGGWIRNEGKTSCKPRVDRANK